MWPRSLDLLSARTADVPGYKGAMSEVRSLLERSCTLGHDKSCLEAGFMHHVGFGGLERDDRKAIEWLTRASAGGEVKSELAEMVQSWQSAPSATAAVEALFSGGSDRGTRLASHRLLGHIFSQGEDELRDWGRALHRFRDSLPSRELACLSSSRKNSRSQ